MAKLTGEVVSVAANAKTMIVKEQSGRREMLDIDNRVSIRKVGRPVLISDIIDGDKVTVHYNMIADKKIATTIYIR